MNKKTVCNDWKPIRVGMLFTAKRGKSRTLQGLSSGNIPVIAAARYNQGIAGYYAIEAEYKNMITISCNGAGCGSVFYHNYPFSITGDAIVLEEKFPMSDYSKLFITAVYDKYFNENYSYEEKCSAAKAENEYVLLPVDETGNPDFLYMETYIKNLKSKVNSTLTNLKSAKKFGHSNIIDTLNWKEYIFGELFVMLPQKEISPIMAYQDNLQDDTVYPYYGQSSENNGIISYIHLKDDSLLNNRYYNYVVMIHSNNHLAFLVNQPFYLKDGHGATSLFTNEHLNYYTCQFIVATINKTMEKQFDYTTKATKEKLKSLVIKLPSLKDGTPDWDYMEQYIKAVQAKVYSNPLIKQYV